MVFFVVAAVFIKEIIPSTYHGKSEAEIDASTVVLFPPLAQRA